MRATRVVRAVVTGFGNDHRYPLITKWQKPVDERVAQHPVIDETIVCEFAKGTFVMCNERYPSIERLADQYFPGFIPRTADEFKEVAEKDESMTVEELMLESIGCWNAALLVREYSTQFYSGAKLSTPMQWEVAGIQDYLPKYYKSWRTIVNYLGAKGYSFYDSEMVLASPKYKVGGIIPQLMHITELGFKRILILYPTCHNDFDVYPAAGETRYAMQPLDYLLYSHTNYYHVVLNMYKWMLVQEGFCEPTDIVSMALVNMSINGHNEIESRLYMMETDDRIREALEKRFSGVGPAADTMSREWFERKELWQEEENDLRANARDRDVNQKRRDADMAFNEWSSQVQMKDDVFKQFLDQQQRELQEDRQSRWWQFKNQLWHMVGGAGPLTRDMKWGGK
eukprot:TRINITY_DN28410_c0_g1_i1.p1 TRINITY_DN28410_c0_g1~~TRINITY_DN28410_c0_g1_i1.p1  ORF type:complete len:397 (+),score=99.20 TRINITY_DN28410_c0_g1_i1:88-1278(+)